MRHLINIITEALDSEYSKLIHFPAVAEWLQADDVKGIGAFLGKKSAEAAKRRQALTDVSPDLLRQAFGEPQSIFSPMRDIDQWRAEYNGTPILVRHDGEQMEVLVHPLSEVEELEIAKHFRDVFVA